MPTLLKDKHALHSIIAAHAFFYNSLPRKQKLMKINVQLHGN
jgi:hypothetical protein